MADVQSAPIDTTSTVPATDSVASPSPSPVDSSAAPSAPAGDTAGAPEKTSARDVWREMQAAESGGTPPDTPPDPSPAQAATQPDGTPEAPGSHPARGPIPYDRHKAVITNTATKARADTMEEFGLVDGTSKDDVTTGINLVRMLKQDPHTLVRLVQSQIADDRPRGAERPADTPPADPEPEPDIPLRDGRAVYSADQLRTWHQWHARQMQQQIDQTYGPIREAHELQTLKAKQTQEAQHLVSAAKPWPLFEELRPHIKAHLQGLSRLTATSFHDAYIAAYRAHGEQILRAQWDAERTGQLTRKANAGTVQPGAPRPTTPRPDSELTTREIVRQEYRRAAG